MHSIRVCFLSTYLAIQSKMNIREIYLCGTAGLYHDIGKLKIPKSILNKPASLSESERSTIDKHSMLGYDILQNYCQNEKIKQIVLLHHGIKYGSFETIFLPSDILKYSELVRTADIYDAVTTDRPYRKALIKEKALDILKENHVPSTYTSMLAKL